MFIETCFIYTDGSILNKRSAAAPIIDFFYQTPPI